MSTATSRQIFVNLAVKDLPGSMRFFGALGFGFDPHFTNDDAACMVIGEGIYAMLVTEPFFRGFTQREPCDTGTHTEALLALSCDSREEVDALAAKALAAGGSACMPAQDHGFMYAKSFYDPDGHHWEVFWMDPTAVGA